MPTSAKYNQTISGTQSGRKTLVTGAANTRLKSTSIVTQIHTMSNRSSSASCTVQLILGYTNWASGDNQEHVIRTITLKKNEQIAEGGTTTTTINTIGRPGRDMYARIYANQSGASGNVDFTVTYNTITKPSVNVGDTITDTQMDNLRAWMNQGNDIADQAQVKATDGNTYRSGLTAGSTTVAASWYNAAANSIT